MNIYNHLLPSSVVCVTLAVAAVSGFPQTPDPATRPQVTEQTSQKPMMPKLAPEHAALKKLVGKWEASVTATMPGEAAKTSTGKAEYEAIGETWVASNFTGEMDGKPFFGHGIEGFDTLKNKYVYIWVDSMSTEAHLFEGVKDPASNTTTLTGECHDPQTGRVVKQRMVTEMKGDDAMTMRIFMTGPDEKEVEATKIEFKRAGRS
jgi:hypothetical protein